LGPPGKHLIILVAPEAPHNRDAAGRVSGAARWPAARRRRRSPAL